MKNRRSPFPVDGYSDREIRQQPRPNKREVCPHGIEVNKMCRRCEEEDRDDSDYRVRYR